MALAVTLTKQLPAADDNGICETQTPTVAGALSLDGDLVTGGVAYLVTPQRVFITSNDDDTATVFTVNGTSFNDITVSETLNGGDSVAVNTDLDFLTVTSVYTDGATAGAIIVGTGGKGSTEPTIFDLYANPSTKTAAVTQSGTANWSLELSADYLAPYWDIYTNPVNWTSPSAFSAKAVNTYGQLEGTYTMGRLTVNSGTGAVTAKINTPFVATS